MNTQLVSQKRPQGRPRPSEVMERDSEVLRLVREHPHTRNQIRDRLGLGPDYNARVYLSLRRLRDQGLIRMCLGAGSDRVWTAEIDAPCP